MGIFQVITAILLITICVLLYRIYDAIVDIRVDFLEGNAQAAEISYWKNKTMGNNQGAYEDLLNIIFSSINNPLLKEKQSRDLYEELKISYERNFEELGYSFPEYKLYQND